MDWVDDWQEPTHYNLHTGLPCSCGWGEPKKGKLKRSSSVNIRRIRKQDQKIFRSDEGKQFLDALEHYTQTHPQIEPLIPWLTARFKHGEFKADPNYSEPTITVNRTGTRMDRFIPDWVQWMNARNHPLRRGHNIIEKSEPELSNLALQLRKDVEARQKKQNWLVDYGETGDHALHFSPDLPYLDDEYDQINERRAYEGPEVACPSCGLIQKNMAGECRRCDYPLEVPDHVGNLLDKYRGWTVRQLRSRHDCEAESEANGHCIGSDHQNYKGAIESDAIRAYSLRDPEGYPAVTWHFNPDDTLAHIQGRGGYPKPDYRDLISIFNHHTGLDDKDGGEGYEQDLGEYGNDAQVQLPDPENVEGYIDQYHPDANYHEWAHEYADNGIGENTEILMGDPDWNSMYYDLRNEEDEKKRYNFYQTVLYNRHHDAWAREMAGFHEGIFRGVVDDKDRQIAQEWDQAFQRSHNQRGQFQAPYYNWGRPGWETAWEDVNRPLFQTCPDCGLTYRQEQLGPKACPECTRLEASVPPQQRQANILDPVHNMLAPEVWDHPSDPRPSLKNPHRQWIMREVYRLATKFAPSPDMWLKLVLTGSLTTYQYATTSDCDISLFVDEFKLPEWDRARLIGLMVQHMDGTKLPGTPYEMQCFVVPKGIHYSDLYQPGLRSGYDLQSDTWVVPPDKSRIHDVQREQNSDYVYALESADKMERLLRYDPDKAVQFWHQIHSRRRRDQAAGKGDFSQANIVYKFLANRGLFPQISEISGEYIAKTAAMRCPKCGHDDVEWMSYRDQTDYLHEGYQCTWCGEYWKNAAELMADRAKVGYNQRMAITTPWGQDHDEWAATRPDYASPGHQLGYNPKVHRTGKGFILDDGSVWTWPTHLERPMHLEYNYKTKKLPASPIPTSAFHIGPGGVIFFYGPGRGITEEQSRMIEEADPRLNVQEYKAPAFNPFKQGGLGANPLPPSI